MALNYERNMLRATAIALAGGPLDDRVIQNALIESFLIHARLLIEFLYERRKNEDDIRPEDWLDPDRWKTARGKKSTLLKGTYEDAHKYLAHLTATHLNEKKTWDYPAILREIETLLDEFMQHMQGKRGLIPPGA